MPIFEYICEKCGSEFSELVRSGDDNPECPVCFDKNVKKKMSVFGSSGLNDSFPPTAPRSCSPFG